VTAPSVLLRENLRRAVRASPTLYRLYLRTGDPKNTRLPRGGDLLHLTGFPRSANTYASYLVLTAAPGCEDRISTHHHAPATIRMALQARVPTVVLIRDPLEAIASKLVMVRATPFDEQRANELVRDYSAYYHYVERVRNRITIIDTRSVIQDPVQFLGQIRASAPGLEMDCELQRVIEEVEVLFQQTIEPRRAPQDRVMPDPQKEKLKEPIRALVRSAPGYQAIEGLYARLSPRW
jgi:hypothetical protein